MQKFIRIPYLYIAFFIIFNLLNIFQEEYILTFKNNNVFNQDISLITPLISALVVAYSIKLYNECKIKRAG
ncbi:MAG: hypothetical protein ACRCWM_07590 [Sarcina sp.]